MSQKVVVFSGRKQAGKNTCSNFIHGKLMKNAGVTKEFEINDEGQLMVYAETYEDDILVQSGMGVLDLERVDREFVEWMSQQIWPMVKVYHFADYLKSVCMDLFGLTHKQCYGSNEDKETHCEVKWKDISFALPPRTVGELKKSGRLDTFMTARQFLQEFGTNICRKIRHDCWVDACFADIKKENVPLAIVADCRFPNEVEGSQKHGAKVVRLTRNPFPEDTHPSETALDKYPLEKYDAVIDNKEMSIRVQNAELEQLLVDWGWL